MNTEIRAFYWKIALAADSNMDSPLRAAHPTPVALRIRSAFPSRHSRLPILPVLSTGEMQTLWRATNCRRATMALFRAFATKMEPRDP